MVFRFAGGFPAPASLGLFNFKFIQSGKPRKVDG